MPLMTQAEYARHRGCKESTVSEAKRDRIRSAVIPRGKRFLIDSDLADRLWVENRRRPPVGGESQPPLPPSPGPSITSPPSEDALAAFIRGLPEDQIPEQGESLKRQLHYKAERERVAALKEREQVLDKDRVKSEAFALGKSLRESILSVPDRLAAKLAVTTDIGQCREILRAELSVALRALSNA
jgi:hypothetical protein